MVSVIFAGVQQTVAAPPPEHILGVYSKPGPHCYFDTDGRPARCDDVITDRLRITRKKKQAHVDLRLRGQVGHGCSLSAPAEWIDDRLILESKSSADGAQVCWLEITFDKDVARLHDPTQGCYELYCSQRGWIDNVELPRLETTKLKKKAR